MTSAITVPAYDQPKLQPGSRATIETISIPTRNRPRTLARAIESYFQNARDFGRAVQFLIIDDSDDQNAGDVEEALKALSRSKEIPIFLSSRRDRARLASAISEETGMAEYIASFAILGDRRLHKLTFGACRNTAYLALQQSCFLSVDDDTVCRLYRRTGEDKGVDEMNWRQNGLLPGDHGFHLSLDEARNSAKEVHRDFVGLHEDMLDYRLAGDRQVVLSNVGLIGDCAAEWPGYFLFLEQSQRAGLFARPEAFFDKVSSRQVTLSVPRLTFWNGPVLRGMNMGIDAREPLPPFMPTDRGEDHLFSMVLQFCSPHAATGLHPLMLLHDPPEPRTDLEWCTPALGLIRPLTVMKALLMAFETSSPGGDRWRTMHECGEFLVERCQQSTEDLARTIGAQMEDNLTGKLDFLARLRAEYGHSLIAPYLDRLSETARRSRESLRAQPAQAWESSRCCASLYGEVLRSWRDIVLAGARLPIRSMQKVDL